MSKATQFYAFSEIVSGLLSLLKCSLAHLIMRVENATLFTHTSLGWAC